MRKLLAAFILFSLTLWAAGFWDKKKYSEWSDKETEKILKDSPWAHEVEVPMGGGGRGLGVGGGGGGRKGSGGDGMPNGANGTGGGGGARGGGGGDDSDIGGMSAGGAMPTMSAVVRWQSALPMKQALARTRLGSEAATFPEGQKILAPNTENYVITIGPLPAQMIRGDATAIKAGATLSIKGKGPIAAADVQGERESKGVNLILLFPRSNAITVEDNEVEVAFKLNALNIRKKFKLKDMMFDGKLEL